MTLVLICIIKMIPKRLSQKCPTDLKLLTLFVKSGLCFIFATPFCTVFVYSNVYQSHFFCTYCVLQTFFVTLVNLRFTIKFCFTKLARKGLYLTMYLFHFCYAFLQCFCFFKCLSKSFFLHLLCFAISTFNKNNHIPL